MQSIINTFSYDNFSELNKLLAYPTNGNALEYMTSDKLHEYSTYLLSQKRAGHKINNLVLYKTIYLLNKQQNNKDVNAFFVFKTDMRLYRNTFTESYIEEIWETLSSEERDVYGEIANIIYEKGFKEKIPFYEYRKSCEKLAKYPSIKTILHDWTKMESYEKKLYEMF